MHVCLAHLAVSVNDVCRVTGASPPVDLVPVMDMQTTVTLRPGAASAVRTTAQDTPVTGTVPSLRRLIQ